MPVVTAVIHSNGTTVHVAATSARTTKDRCTRRVAAKIWDYNSLTARIYDTDM